MQNYNLFQRLLHHVVLNNNYIPEFFFDLEKFFFKKEISSITQDKHLFITGLPRAGTTIIMKKLYETKKFASLTYRDMPFLLSPNLWSKAIGRFIKKTEPRMRPHGDGIMIDINSPEAFDEIFWRVFSNKYIQKNKLIKINYDEEIIKNFKDFVALILIKYNKKNFLSKNNCNLLRIETISKVFSDSLILIPFRNPVQQSYSLLNQHLNFKKIHKENGFAKKYMEYLVHHEFGMDHKYMELDVNFENSNHIDTISYWLKLWINTYGYLLNSNVVDNEHIFFIPYEDFCQRPNDYTNAILKKLNINFKLTEKISMNPSKIENNSNSDSKLFLESQKIYKKMLDNSKII